MANPFALLKAATRYLPAVVILPSQDSLTAQLTGINRFGLSGFAALEIPRYENTELLKAGYMENHYVFTIADWKAAQLAKAPPVVYEVKSKSHLAKYLQLKGDARRDAYALQYKAIEEIENPADPLVMLLARPNPSQTWAEFAYALSVYWDFGNALCYGVRVELGPNKGQIRELYLLPPSIYGGKNPTVSGYESFYSNTANTPDITGTDVMHLRRFNPDPDMQGGQLWGMSKLLPARKLLTKSNNAVEAEAEMMQNRGGRTIIFPKGQQWDENVSAETAKGTQEIRNKLKQAGSGGIVSTGVELGSIELSMSPVDLDLLGSNAITKEEFCALWHVNVISVFSAMTGATYANMEEANKGSLRGGVLPDLALLSQKLNQWLVPGYNESMKVSRYIEFNTDVYPELQTDKAQAMGWMSQLAMSENERRAAMGYDAVDLPEMNIPTIPTTRQPITDFGAAPADANANPANAGGY